MPSSRGPSHLRNWTQVSHTAGGFFTSWATRKAQEYWSSSLSVFQGNFLNQESNQGLLHYRWILYQLSYQGSPALSTYSIIFALLFTLSFLLSLILDFRKEKRHFISPTNPCSTAQNWKKSHLKSMTNNADRGPMLPNNSIVFLVL